MVINMNPRIDSSSSNVVNTKTAVSGKSCLILRRLFLCTEQMEGDSSQAKNRNRKNINGAMKWFPMLLSCIIHNAEDLHQQLKQYHRKYKWPKLADFHIYALPYPIAMPVSPIVTRKSFRVDYTTSYHNITICVFCVYPL